MVPFIAGAQAALGIAQTVKGSIDAKKLMKKLKPFETPEEVIKHLNATQSSAQQGYDPFTFDYLNNQVDRAASESLGAATRLGADPNELSSLLDQRLQGIMKIGAENHNLNMKNFDKYLGALDVVGKNKEAEWASEQNLLKDKLQQAATNKAQGLQNIGNAANAFISYKSAMDTAKLYKNDAPNVIDDGTGGSDGLFGVGRITNAIGGTNRTLPNLSGISPQAPSFLNSVYDVRRAVQGILPLQSTQR